MSESDGDRERSKKAREGAGREGLGFSFRVRGSGRIERISHNRNPQAAERPVGLRARGWILGPSHSLSIKAMHPRNPYTAIHFRAGDFATQRAENVKSW